MIEGSASASVQEQEPAKGEQARAASSPSVDHGISWSCCHESPVSWEYCAPILEQAAASGVRRLEVTGITTGDLGNVDGYVYYRSYPQLQQTRDVAAIAKNVEDLRRICQRGHELGIEVDLWHREVFLPEALFELEPDLLNDDGDIDFGGRYLEIVREKTEELFANVPELDGLVVTLTEAMFPIIHVANKDANPPEQNIEAVLRVFIDVCAAKGKRIIIRPFTAINQDYQYLRRVILRLADEAPLTTEIKIVPGDWHPYLPINPMIDELAATDRLVEMDLMGEYLGHGQVPCCFVGDVKRYVKWARDRQITQAVIRVDRSGTRAMDVANDINVAAAHELWRNPETEIDEIYSRWAQERYGPDLATPIAELLKRTFDIATGALYIDQHNISHWAYLDFTMLKWSRFFGFFREGEPLHRTTDEWAIISSRISPPHDQIEREKTEAVELADQCAEGVVALRDQLDAETFTSLHDGFVRWAVIARAYRQVCRLAMTYLPVLWSGASETAFQDEVAQAGRLADAIEAEMGTGFYGRIGPQLRDVAHQMATELRIEQDVAQRNKDDAQLVDWVLCGGVSFEWAVRKQTHGSWVHRSGDVIYRRAGSRVIADGFFEYEMRVPAGRSTLRLLWGDTGEERQAYVDVDGQRQVVKAGGRNGFGWVELPLSFDAAGVVPIRITKKAEREPMISEMQIRR